MIIVKIIGGLGNQLFQYATGRAISIEQKADLKLDISFFNNDKYRKVYKLGEFNLPFQIAVDQEIQRLKNSESTPIIKKILNKIGIRIYPYAKRSHLKEKDILKLYNSNKDKNLDYYIEGWLADEVYFKKQRKIILEDLKIEHLLDDESKLVLNEIKITNAVAVHIRRGDYLTNSYFSNLDKEYYQAAMNHILREVETPVFFFFSDDIQWVKENYSSINNSRFVEHNSTAATEWNTIGEISDLILMSSCKHQIIANSTFSWWGAWLNQNPEKIVIAPAKWYNNEKAQRSYETGTFLPIDWIKI